MEESEETQSEDLSEAQPSEEEGGDEGTDAPEDGETTDGGDEEASV